MMQHFTMLSHIQALLTGLKVAGFELDVKVAFKRYAIASVGPVLAVSFTYYVFTVSSLCTAWFFVPVAVFGYAGALVTYKVVAFVNRRLKASSDSLTNRGDGGRCMVEAKRIAAGFMSNVGDSKSWSRSAQS